MTGHRPQLPTTEVHEMIEILNMTISLGLYFRVTDKNIQQDKGAVREMADLIKTCSIGWDRSTCVKTWSGGEHW